MASILAQLKPLTWALILVGGFLLVSFVGFWLVVRPPRLVIGGAPADYGLTAEDVRVATDDGLTLAGWLVPRPGRPAVVVLHGYPAEKADMLPIAAALAPHFAVLLLDFRSFGQSEGVFTTLGLRERADVRRALDLLEARGYDAIGAFGFSLGGAVALTTAAEDPRLRAVAAYAPFADLRALGRDVYRGLWLLRYPLVEAMVLWGRLVLGGDLTRPSPEAAARRLGIPVLLIASRGDEQIPFAHAERLRAALARSPGADLHVLETGRHGALDPDVLTRLVTFFLAHLGPA